MHFQEKLKFPRRQLQSFVQEQLRATVKLRWISLIELAALRANEQKVASLQSQVN